MLRKFFSYRHNFAPKGPDFGEKDEQKRPIASKRRGIFIIWRVKEFICFYFSLSSTQYWIFRRGARSGDRFRFQGLNINLSIPMMKRMRKLLEERAGAVAQASPPVETPGSLHAAPPQPAAPIIKDRPPRAAVLQKLPGRQQGGK